MEIPASQWAKAQTFSLTETFPHRREYLTYEGPVSGDRGEVKRVDEGFAAARVWEADRMELELRLRGFVGRLDLRRIDGERWEAQVG